jgi:hypothetical protein
MSNKLPPFTKKTHLTKKTIPIDINGMFGDNLRFDTNDKFFGGSFAKLFTPICKRKYKKRNKILKIKSN